MKVVESKTAPKVRMQGGMHMAIPASEGGGMEPLVADEIVEVPDDNLRAEARDTHLSLDGVCTAGHPQQREAGRRQISAPSATAPTSKARPVPPLAGRSPSYMMRQLFDMKTGARRGRWAELMKPVVARCRCRK